MIEKEILTKPSTPITFDSDWHLVKSVSQFNYFYQLVPYNSRLFNIFKADIYLDTNVSLRRRIETDLDTNKTQDFFVLKSSVNGTNRIEKNISVRDLSEEALLHLESFPYASKWRRFRSVYENDLYPYIEFYFNKNSGYGDTVELEYVGQHTENVFDYLRSTAGALGLQELTKQQLDCMYTKYCSSWQYYFDNNAEFSKSVWQELGINV